MGGCSTAQNDLRPVDLRETLFFQPAGLYRLLPCSTDFIPVFISVPLVIERQSSPLPPPHLARLQLPKRKVLGIHKGSHARRQNQRSVIAIIDCPSSQATLTSWCIPGRRAQGIPPFFFFWDAALPVGGRGCSAQLHARQRWMQRRRQQSQRRERDRSLSPPNCVRAVPWKCLRRTTQRCKDAI